MAEDSGTKTGNGGGSTSQEASRASAKVSTIEGVRIERSNAKGSPVVMIGESPKRTGGLRGSSSSGSVSSSGSGSGFAPLLVGSLKLSLSDAMAQRDQEFGGRASLPRMESSEYSAIDEATSGFHSARGPREFKLNLANNMRPTRAKHSQSARDKDHAPNNMHFGAAHTLQTHHGGHQQISSSSSTQPQTHRIGTRRISSNSNIEVNRQPQRQPLLRSASSTAAAKSRAGSSGSAQNSARSPHSASNNTSSIHSPSSNSSPIAAHPQLRKAQQQIAPIQIALVSPHRSPRSPHSSSSPSSSSSSNSSPHLQSMTSPNTSPRGSQFVSLHSASNHGPVSPLSSSSLGADDSISTIHRIPSPMPYAMGLQNLGSLPSSSSGSNTPDSPLSPPLSRRGSAQPDEMDSSEARESGETENARSGTRVYPMYRQTSCGSDVDDNDDYVHEMGHCSDDSGPSDGSEICDRSSSTSSGDNESGSEDSNSSGDFNHSNGSEEDDNEVEEGSGNEILGGVEEIDGVAPSVVAPHRRANQRMYSHHANLPNHASQPMHTGANAANQVLNSVALNSPHSSNSSGGEAGSSDSADSDVDAELHSLSSRRRSIIRPRATHVAATSPQMPPSGLARPRAKVPRSINANSTRQGTNSPSHLSPSPLATSCGPDSAIPNASHTSHFRPHKSSRHRPKHGSLGSDDDLYAEKEDVELAYYDDDEGAYDAPNEGSPRSELDEDGIHSTAFRAYLADGTQTNTHSDLSGSVIPNVTQTSKYSPMKKNNASYSRSHGQPPSTHGAGVISSSQNENFNVSRSSPPSRLRSTGDARRSPQAPYNTLGVNEAGHLGGVYDASKNISSRHGSQRTREERRNVAEEDSNHYLQKRRHNNMATGEEMGEKNEFEENEAMGYDDEVGVGYEDKDVDEEYEEEEEEVWYDDEDEGEGEQNDYDLDGEYEGNEDFDDEFDALSISPGSSAMMMYDSTYGEDVHPPIDFSTISVEELIRDHNRNPDLLYMIEMADATLVNWLCSEETVEKLIFALCEQFSALTLIDSTTPGRTYEKDVLSSFSYYLITSSPDAVLPIFILKNFELFDLFFDFAAQPGFRSPPDWTRTLLFLLSKGQASDIIEEYMRSQKPKLKIEKSDQDGADGSDISEEKSRYDDDLLHSETRGHFATKVLLSLVGNDNVARLFASLLLPETCPVPWLDIFPSCDFVPLIIKKMDSLLSQTRLEFQLNGSNDAANLTDLCALITSKATSSTLSEQIQDTKFTSRLVEIVCKKEPHPLASHCLSMMCNLFDISYNNNEYESSQFPPIIEALLHKKSKTLKQAVILTEIPKIEGENKKSENRFNKVTEISLQSNQTSANSTEIDTEEDISCPLMYWAWQLDHPTLQNIPKNELSSLSSYRHQPFGVYRLELLKSVNSLLKTNYGLLHRQMFSTGLVSSVMDVLFRHATASMIHLNVADTIGNVMYFERTEWLLDWLKGYNLVEKIANGFELAAAHLITPTSPSSPAPSPRNSSISTSPSKASDTPAISKTNSNSNLQTSSSSQDADSNKKNSTSKGATINTADSLSKDAKEGKDSVNILEKEISDISIQPSSSVASQSESSSSSSSAQQKNDLNSTTIEVQRRLGGYCTQAEYAPHLVSICIKLDRLASSNAPLQAYLSSLPKWDYLFRTFVDPLSRQYRELSDVASLRRTVVPTMIAY